MYTYILAFFPSDYYCIAYIFLSSLFKLLIKPNRNGIISSYSSKHTGTLLRVPVCYHLTFLELPHKTQQAKKEKNQTGSFSSSSKRKIEEKFLHIFLLSLLKAVSLLHTKLAFTFILLLACLILSVSFFFLLYRYMLKYRVSC